MAFSELYPASEGMVFEVSPYNYVLYFEILRFQDSANYTIGFVEAKTETLSLTVTG